MIGSLGVPELLFILVLALLIFGPRKLPEIGRTLGRALGEFRRATSDLKHTLDVELSSDELRAPLTAQPSDSKPRAQERLPASSPVTDEQAAPVTDEPSEPESRAGTHNETA